MKKIMAAVPLLIFAVICMIDCDNPFTDDNSENDCSDYTGEVMYNPAIDPANFVSTVDNQYYPLVPGTTYTYTAETEDGTEKNEVYVTHQTREILGVTCTVVDDKVWLDENEDNVWGDDELIEATLDWYAQDKDGNVWYMGEDSKEYEDGEFVGSEGSWEAGIDGAKPGIIMLANPIIGLVYRQEYYEDEAEDKAEILSLNESVTVPFGSYDNCLRTRDWNPLEMDTIEEKYYAPGIGVVLEVTVKGDNERVELISITTE